MLQQSSSGLGAKRTGGKHAAGQKGQNKRSVIEVESERTEANRNKVKRSKEFILNTRLRARMVYF